MLDQLLTAWTVRLALGCYAVVLAGRLAGCKCGKTNHALRAVWTLGCALAVAHAACAFQFYHAWSHALAAADTARQTRELLGWEAGWGVYFNYLFLAVWTCDAGWLQLGAASYERRPRWLDITIQAYLFFIVVNGAVVFASGAVRWVSAAACAVLGALAVRRLLVGRREIRPADDGF